MNSTAGLSGEIGVSRGDWSLLASLEVGPGEVIAVLGPNGAGKSTLLRALSGLTPLTSGSLRLDDRVLDDPGAGVWVPPERRGVGVVFQDYRLFAHLDVRANVGFGPSLSMPRREARARADEWLHRADLTHIAERRPAQLSGGQAQRVALLRALASTPTLLLLDEPTAALDATVRGQTREFLRQHIRDFSGPTVLVTHHPIEAMVLADRMLVLEAGRVVQVGSCADIARRPATPWTATLMGLNLYRGRLSGDGAVELDRGGRLVMSGVVPAPQDELLVAVRPSAITVATERPAGTSARNTWPATIADLELLNDRVRIDARGAPDALVDVTPQAVAELGLRPGSTIWLSVKATDVSAYAAG